MTVVNLTRGAARLTVGSSRTERLAASVCVSLSVCPFVSVSLGVSVHPCVEPCVGEPMELLVDASALEKGRCTRSADDVTKLLAVSVTGPDGDQQPADVCLDDSADQLYRCSYTPATEGLYVCLSVSVYLIG